MGSRGQGGGYARIYKKDDGSIGVDYNQGEKKPGVVRLLKENLRGVQTIEDINKMSLADTGGGRLVYKGVNLGPGAAFGLKSHIQDIINQKNVQRDWSKKTIDVIKKWLDKYPAGRGGKRSVEEAFSSYINKGKQDGFVHPGSPFVSDKAVVRDGKKLSPGKHTSDIYVMDSHINSTGRASYTVHKDGSITFGESKTKFYKVAEIKDGNKTTQVLSLQKNAKYGEEGRKIPSFQTIREVKKGMGAYQDDKNKKVSEAWNYINKMDRTNRSHRKQVTRDINNTYELVKNQLNKNGTLRIGEIGKTDNVSQAVVALKLKYGMTNQDIIDSMRIMHNIKGYPLKDQLKKQGLSEKQAEKIRKRVSQEKDFLKQGYVEHTMDTHGYGPVLKQKSQSINISKEEAEAILNKSKLPALKQSNSVTQESPNGKYDYTVSKRGNKYYLQITDNEPSLPSNKKDRNTLFKEIEDSEMKKIVPSHKDANLSYDKQAGVWVDKAGYVQYKSEGTRMQEKDEEGKTKVTPGYSKKVYQNIDINPLPKAYETKSTTKPKKVKDGSKDPLENIVKHFKQKQQSKKEAEEVRKYGMKKSTLDEKIRNARTPEERRYYQGLKNHGRDWKGREKAELEYQKSLLKHAKSYGEFDKISKKIAQSEYNIDQEKRREKEIRDYNEFMQKGTKPGKKSAWIPYKFSSDYQADYIKKHGKAKFDKKTKSLKNRLEKVRTSRGKSRTRKEKEAFNNRIRKLMNEAKELGQLNTFNDLKRMLY